MYGCGHTDKGKCIFFRTRQQSINNKTSIKQGLRCFFPELQSMVKLRLIKCLAFHLKGIIYFQLFFSFT